MLRKENIYLVDVSKHNSKCKKQFTILMIANGEGWYCLAVKENFHHYQGKQHLNITAIAFILLQQKANVNLIKKYVIMRSSVTFVMASKDTKMLEFNQNQKFDKTLFIIIYADLECFIEKIGGNKNNSENSFTTKVSKHIPSDFSMSAMSSFKGKEDNHDVYKGKDFMKKFCKSLRQHAMEVISFKKKKMELLTKKQQQSFHSVRICYICEKKN